MAELWHTSTGRAWLGSRSAGGAAKWRHSHGTILLVTTEGNTNHYGAITDVPGVAVGSAERTGDGWLTGVTVVLPPPGTVGAVDVRGGGPGTHETDALAPGTLVSTVDAVTLTGGSAYGLVTAHGVQRWCEEHGRGFPVGEGLVVPIVPAAAVFDLGRGGDPAARPDVVLGYEAMDAATHSRVRTGSVGAGTGAQCNAGVLKGGVGTASVRLPGDFVVGALVVLNAVGSPYDADGALYAAQWVDDPELRPRRPTERPPVPSETRQGKGFNTTLAVVATNARLDRAQLRRAAASGHDGLARALRPVHTLLDGDSVFALATGEAELTEVLTDQVAQVAAVQAAAADAVTLAVLDAVLSATGVENGVVRLPAYAEVCPSAVPEALRR
jgi:putative pantetheine hydrolase